MAAVVARPAPLGTPFRSIVAGGVTIVALAFALALVDVDAVIQALSRLSFVTLLVVALALMCGALLACARLACIAWDLGFQMRASDAIAALSLGQLAGAIFFQLVGQLIARSAVLAPRGVPVAGTVLMTGYERLIASAVSLGLAIAGGWYLFGKITLDLEAGGATFLKVAAGGTIAAVASGALAWGRPAYAFIRANMGRSAVWRLGRSLVLSLAIQACTMTAYIAAVIGLAPDIDTIDIAAAAAVVMLAASVPISLAGWGVRELGAIFALGAIGLGREAAVVVAVLIGAVALGVVAILAAGSALLRAVPRVQDVPPAAPIIDVTAILCTALPVLATIGVFFQIHVPLSSSRLNVNLADPLVIVAAALFALDRIRARQLPVWRLSFANAHLALMTALIVLAFILGWADFGATAWALTNRLVGWFVLLAYLATGALIVSRTAGIGLTILLRTYVAVALGIIALELVIFGAVRIGLPVPTDIAPHRIEGFAQNPNAFSLQVLFAIAAIVATVTEARAQTVALSVAFLGLWYSGSRAGLIAIAVVLAAAMMLRSLRATRLVGAAILSVAAAAFIHWIPDIVLTAAEILQWAVNGTVWLVRVITESPTADPYWSGPALVLNPRSPSSIEIIASGYESSNAQRIESFKGAIELFQTNPILGAGLGAFIENYTRTHGVPLVIHSTPLWLLAELGTIGLVAFAAPFIRALKYEMRYAGRNDLARDFIILVLVAFGVIAAVHDMMYQRAFWLLLGAGLALHPRAVRAHIQSSGVINDQRSVNNVD